MNYTKEQHRIICEFACKIRTRDYDPNFEEYNQKVEEEIMNIPIDFTSIHVFGLDMTVQIQFAQFCHTLAPDNPIFKEYLVEVKKIMDENGIKNNL